MVLKELVQRMQKVRLTNTGSKLAEFILAQGSDVCFMTSTDMAAAAGVSEASVIRFARVLGFDGYMDFQRYLRVQYQADERRGGGTNFDLSGSLLLRDAAEKEFLEEYYVNSILNIESFFSQNTWQALDEAATLLTQSGRKFIIASRANSGIGSSCFLILRHLLPDVYFTASAAASVIDTLSDAQTGDCVLAFCFPRYSDLDMLSLEMVRRAGARIIVVTDHIGSSPAQFAHLVLTVRVNTDFGFTSFVGARFVMELLCACVGRKVGRGNEEKLRRIDRYLGQLKLY